ncbi:hypothetical protein STEG23_037183 [Scotinomys teguina]
MGALFVKAVEPLGSDVRLEEVRYCGQALRLWNRTPLLFSVFSLMANALYTEVSHICRRIFPATVSLHTEPKETLVQYFIPVMRKVT